MTRVIPLKLYPGALPPPARGGPGPGSSRFIESLLGPHDWLRGAAIQGMDTTFLLRLDTILLLRLDTILLLRLDTTFLLRMDTTFLLRMDTTFLLRMDTTLLLRLDTTLQNGVLTCIRTYEEQNQYKQHSN